MESLRRGDVLEQISKSLELLRHWEDERRLSLDPTAGARAERAIANLKRDVLGYEAELRAIEARLAADAAGYVGRQAGSAATNEPLPRGQRADLLRAIPPPTAEYLRVVRIVVVSPGDLFEEYARVPEVVDDANRTLALPLGMFVTFHAWEDSRLGSTRSRPIHAEEISRSDLFVLLLWKHWGQPTLAHSSATQAAFELARRGNETTGRPNLLIYVKKPPTELLADPGEQLQRVLAFRRQLEQTTSDPPYYSFDETEAWQALFRAHLARWLSQQLSERPSDSQPELLSELSRRVHQLEHVIMRTPPGIASNGQPRPEPDIPLLELLEALASLEEGFVPRQPADRADVAAWMLEALDRPASASEIPADPPLTAKLTARLESLSLGARSHLGRSIIDATATWDHPRHSVASLEALARLAAELRVLGAVPVLSSQFKKHGWFADTTFGAVTLDIVGTLMAFGPVEDVRTALLSMFYDGPLTPLIDARVTAGLCALDPVNYPTYAARLLDALQSYLFTSPAQCAGGWPAEFLTISVQRAPIRV